MSSIFVAGHQGMVGSAIVRNLASKGDHEILIEPRHRLDLLDQESVNRYFKNNRIDQVYLAAARVGGIHANNSYPAEFIYENLLIQTNVIHAAFKNDVSKLLFLGSSCIYPRLAEQPMGESELLTGKLEPTNEPYAVAKIAGIKMCEAYSRQYNLDYRSVMPTNLYGQGDNFHLKNAHVIPAMMRRFHEAKIAQVSQVEVWGTGKPRREFLHVDDMAEACTFIMDFNQLEYEKVTTGVSHVNIGCGHDFSIAELAKKIAKTVGFRGDLVFDTSKQDGAPRKLLDVRLIQGMGWAPRIDLDQGLAITYQWMRDNTSSLRGAW